ncbi:MAG: NAD-dependent epimerase/dehydratase family protein [Rhizobacter sp.]|nr:NAD-dependent epimerase/dehydratase family protein [Chlorobiales bacterium]
MENSRALVTGANGHLGNNLVRHLLKQGNPVRASVRNPKNRAPFEGLNCEVVHGDLMNKASLVKALEGVDTLYQVAASFKLWAKNPQQEIYDVNMQGTRNVLEAAAAQGVRRVVYVSSIAALNYAALPIKESDGYNPDRRNMYYNSKNDSEKVAIDLAAKLNLELVAVLPSAMIGGEAFFLNESYRILAMVYLGKLPVESNIFLNWIDVKDVAAACVAAATKGRAGERYILANEKSMGLSETTALLQSLYPDLGLKVPPKVPRWFLYANATLFELISKLTDTQPLLQRSDVEMFWGQRMDFDITKARTELGFAPKPPKIAVKEAAMYLRSHPQLLSA